VLFAVKGQAAPETGQAFTRARELWEQLGSPPGFLRAAYGEASYHAFRGELDAALCLDESLLRLSHNGRSALAAGTALHVKGFRTPASQWRDEMLGGRRPKSLRGGNRGGVCAGSGVGLWRFSLCMPRSLDIERGSRPSNHRGVGFGRRVQDRNGGLVVSDLRFGGRRRD